MHSGVFDAAARFSGLQRGIKNDSGFQRRKSSCASCRSRFPNGKDANGNQLVLPLLSNGRDVFLEYVKDQWERYLNISVNLQILEVAVWGAKRSQHEMPLYRGQYEYDFLDPANMLTRLWRSSSENGSPRHAWRNVRFDDLVTQAGREIDEPKRLNLYSQAEKVLVEDVGGLFLTHQVTHQVWYPYLTGFAPDKNGNVVFRYLDISRFQMYIRNDVDEWRE